MQNDGEFSEPFEVTNGVKQGCVLARDVNEYSNVRIFALHTNIRMRFLDSNIRIIF